MPTLLQWQRRRARIVQNGLVLNLPFYKLDGNSFRSDDAYGHLCTATNATWGSQGRTEVTDGIILCGSNANLIAVNINFSLVVWVKPTGTTGERDIINTRSLANTDGMALLMLNTSLAPNAYFYVAGFEATACKTSLIQDFFGCIGITKSGNDITYFINGNQENTFTLTGPVVNSLGQFQILAYNEATVTREWAGQMGEVWKWNRVLTATEMLNLYLATKWRYQ